MQSFSAGIWFFACAQSENEPYGLAPTTGEAVGTTDGVGGVGGHGGIGSDSSATSTSSTASSATASNSNSNSNSANTTASNSSNTTGSGGSLTSGATQVTGSSSTLSTSSTLGTTSNTMSTATASATLTGSTGTGGSGGADSCPDDPEKTSPGACGCGQVDDADCIALVDSLLHRYSFEMDSSDVVGNAHATNEGGTISGGSVELSGGAHVDLPNGTVSSLTGATIEVWLTWSGGDAWQRVFDFGDSDAGEEAGSEGVTYLFLTPLAESQTGAVRAAFTTSGPDGETYVEGTTGLATDTSTHVAVSIGSGNLTMYLNGAPAGSEPLAESLSGLNDINNWLGASQFTADPGFEGSIHDFRIYDTVLTADQVEKSYSLGPDAPLLAE